MYDGHIVVYVQYTVRLDIHVLSLNQNLAGTFSSFSFLKVEAEIKTGKSGYINSGYRALIELEYCLDRVGL
jgi:hypothetical protein